MPKVPFKLVRRNLMKHPVRTLLTVASLTVAVFLLCLLRTLVASLDVGVKDARSDRVIVQSAVSLFVDLPLSYQAKIAAVDGVKDTCKWTWFGGEYKDQENFFAQFAVDPDAVERMYPEMVLIEGDFETFKRERTACVIGEKLAKKHGFTIGQTIPIRGILFARLDGEPWEFRVAAIFRSTASTLDENTLFFQHEYLEESIEAEAVIGPEGTSLYVVKVEPGVEPITVMQRIDALFENGPQVVQSGSEAEFQAQWVSMMGNVPFFIGAIGGGVLFAIVLAVMNTMLMAAREQVHDVGILMALGFRRPAVFLSFLAQSLELCLIAGLAGIGLALFASPFLRDQLGTMFPFFHVSRETAMLGLGLALAIGLVAGIAPAMRLARLAPVTALRGGA